MGEELHGAGDGELRSETRYTVRIASRRLIAAVPSSLRSRFSGGIPLVLGIILSLGSMATMTTQAAAADIATATTTVRNSAGTPIAARFALRGTVLPTKSYTATTENKRPVRLASLGHGAIANDATPGVLPRLNFASFRFSFEPARGQKKNATHSKRRSKSHAGHVRLTSLDHSYMPKGKSYRKKFRKVARGSIKWKAYPGCVPTPLKRVLVALSKKFGGVTVNSTHRSHRYNRKIGGAKHSYHLSCQAVDFRLRGSSRRALAYLKKQPEVGGLKHYGGGLFHIDIGRRRTW